MINCFFIASVFLLSFSAAEDKGELKVLFQGIDVLEGKLAIELLNDQEERVGEYWLFVESNTVELVVADLEAGEYAIRFFHDENNSGDMDTNWLGIPTEAFGFSNDAKLKFGPPDFKDMVFNVLGHTEIVINARRIGSL